MRHLEPARDACAEAHAHRIFASTVSVEQALKVFLRHIPRGPIRVKKVSAHLAIGRVLAEPIRAKQPVPAFSRAAVDGFAVRAESTFGASPTNPISLRVGGKVRMGGAAGPPVRMGEAVAVTTGAALPSGTDAVIMMEYTREIDGDEMEVLRPVAPGDDIIMPGEDVAKGQLVFKPGRRLTAVDVGVLHSLRHLRVRVADPPRVAILSTGDELVDARDNGRGRIIDVNRITLSGTVSEEGGVPVDLGICPDEKAELSRRVRHALAQTDMLVTSGGTSVSEIDLVPDVIQEAGPPGLLAHGISIRPAAPTGLAVARGKPVLLLSGYPVACLIGFYLFGRPAVARLLGTLPRPLPHITARLTKRVPHGTGLRTFVRVRVSETPNGYQAEPLPVTGSGNLTSIALANGLLVIPEELEGFEEGQQVSVTLLRPPETRS